MRLTILITVNKDEKIPPSPILAPDAIERFKKIHPGLESIATVIVKEEDLNEKVEKTEPKYGNRFNKSL